MPVVPYQQKVQEQALPRARQSTDAPIEAFGGGASAQGVARAAENLGNTISDFAAKEKAYIDDIQATEADTKLAQKQTDIQVNISKMQGRDANGAREYAAKEMEKAVEEYGSGLTGNGSLAFKKAAANRAEGLYGFSEKHTAAENQKADRGVLVDRLKVLNAKATSNALDDETRLDSALAQDLAEVHDAADAVARFEGIPKLLPDGTNNPSYQQLVNGALSRTHRDVIDARINAGAIDKAYAYFKDYKENMTADDMNYADKRVEDALVVVDGNKIFQQGLQSRLPGGGIDQRAIFKSIDGMEGVSPQRKASIAAFVKARISEENIRQHQADLDTDKSFGNWAIQQKKAGVSIADIAGNLPPSFYRNDLEKHQRQQALYKLFSAEKTVDLPGVLALKEKIRTKGGSLQEVEDYVAANPTSVKDYYSLRAQVLGNKINGIDSQRNAELDLVKEDLKRKFQKDSKTRDEILHSIENETLGKPPEAIRELYKKKMEVVNPDKYFWQSEKKQYQIDREKNKERLKPGAKSDEPRPDQRAAAIAELKRNKKVVNEDTIRLWVKKYGQRIDQ